MTTTTQTLGPLQRAWVDKLRNGGFSQTRGQLHDRAGYCCLGVALEHVLNVAPIAENEGACIYESDVGWTSNSLPTESANAIGLRDEMGVFAMRDLPQAVAADIWSRAKLRDPQMACLAELNDAGFTFSEIADLIEAHPSAFFREAR